MFSTFILLLLKLFSSCTQVLLWYIPLSACPTLNKLWSLCDWPSTIAVYTDLFESFCHVIDSLLFSHWKSLKFFYFRSNLADVTSSLSDQNNTLLDVIHLMVQLQKRWRRDQSRSHPTAFVHYCIGAEFLLCPQYSWYLYLAMVRTMTIHAVKYINFGIISSNCGYNMPVAPCPVWSLCINSPVWTSG